MIRAKGKQHLPAAPVLPLFRLPPHRRRRENSTTHRKRRKAAAAQGGERGRNTPSVKGRENGTSSKKEDGKKAAPLRQNEVEQSLLLSFLFICFVFQVCVVFCCVRLSTITEELRTKNTQSAKLQVPSRNMNLELRKASVLCSTWKLDFRNKEPGT